jgi:hypothetical protein
VRSLLVSGPAVVLTSRPYKYEYYHGVSHNDDYY